LDRTIFAPIIGVITILFAGIASASGEPNDANNLNTLGDYLRYAELNNAGLKASFEEWRFAIEQVPQAKSLSDPVLSYGYATRPTPQRSMFEVMQMFPWFGTIEVRTDAAKAAANAAGKRYQSQQLKLFSEVKQAYYEYSYLARQVEISRENLELLKHFEQVTRIRYATSQMSHPNHIRSQIEISSAQYELQILESLREPLTAKLNSILNRPSFSSLPWPARIEFKDMELNHQQIIALVIQNNPELQAMNFEIDAAKRQVELAKKRFYPEFGLGVAVDAGMGENMSSRTMPKVQVTIPIWRDNYGAGQRQAEAGVRKAGQQKTESQNNMVAQTENVIYNFENSSKKVKLYSNDLIPQTKELLKASEAAYSRGTIDFLNLIEAQRLLLQYRLEYEHSITENAQKAAELEAMCGAELPAAKKDSEK
jgi:outer membrane protein TolC